MPLSFIEFVGDCLCGKYGTQFLFIKGETAIEPWSLVLVTFNEMANTLGIADIYQDGKDSVGSIDNIIDGTVDVLSFQFAALADIFVAESFVKRISS